MEFKLKNDKYRKTRGGYSRFLNIYCSNCSNHTLLYQKDGPGLLKRMYADRIIAPERFSKLQNMNNIEDMPKLTCTNCGQILATPCIYEKERRIAYKVRLGSIAKRVGKGVFPPEVKDKK